MNERTQTKRPRGSVGLYALAFTLAVIGGGLLLYTAATRTISVNIFWGSFAFSTLAFLAAIASVVIRRR